MTRSSVTTIRAECSVGRVLEVVVVVLVLHDSATSRGYDEADEKILMDLGSNVIRL